MFVLGSLISFLNPPKNDPFPPHPGYIVVVVCLTFQVGEEKQQKGIFNEIELDLALPLVGTFQMKMKISWMALVKASMIKKLRFDMFAWAIPKKKFIFQHLPTIHVQGQTC